MRISVLTGLVVGVLATAPQPAGAAEKGGDVPQRMANCLYERYPDRAQRLLQAATASAAENAYVGLLDEPLCGPRVIGDRAYSPEETLGSIHLMRGMLAEQALAGVLPAAQALPVLPARARGYARPWSAATGRHAGVDEMAACVADTNPSGILALLASAPSSADESKAMAGLDGSIKNCLAANLRLATDALPVRAALADALYQRVRNPALSLGEAPEASK